MHGVVLNPFIGEKVEVFPLFFPIPDGWMALSKLAISAL